MAMRRYPYRPAIPVPPGWLLRDYLEARECAPADFARRNSLSPAMVADLLDGAAPLDAEIAAALEREFEPEASFWLGMESEYRSRLAAKQAAKEKTRALQPRFHPDEERSV